MYVLNHFDGFLLLCLLNPVRLPGFPCNRNGRVGAPTNQHCQFTINDGGSVVATRFGLCLPNFWSVRFHQVPHGKPCPFVLLVDVSIGSLPPFGKTLYPVRI